MFNTRIGPLFLHYAFKPRQSSSKYGTNNEHATAISRHQWWFHRFCAILRSKAAGCDGGFMMVGYLYVVNPVNLTWS